MQLEKDTVVAEGIIEDLIVNKKIFNPNINNYVIFCHSYYTIRPMLKILELIEDVCQSAKIKIFVNLSSLHQFLVSYFQNSPDISVVYIGYAGRSRRKLLDEIFILLHIIFLRLNLRRNNNIIFASRYHILHELFFSRLLRIGNNNHFSYIDVYSTEENDVAPKSFIQLSLSNKIKLLICKVVYGFPISYYSHFGQRACLGIDFKYINHRFNVIKEKDLNMIKIVKETKIYTVPYEIIYFDQGIHIFDNEIIDEKKYERLIIDLFKGLQDTGIPRKKIGIKYHPSVENNIYELLDYGTEIEKNIPAEFLKAESCRIVFSAFSTSLKAYGNNCSCLSIIDLLPWKDQASYIKYRERLIRDNNNCIIPKSISEFYTICLSSHP